MNRLYIRIFAFITLFFLLFSPLQAVAADSSADAPISTIDETSTSNPSSDTDGDTKSSPLTILLNILGSGVVCALLTYVLDLRKEQKSWIISAADTLWAAFNVDFSDEFLDRDDSEWGAFKEKYNHFCKCQSSLIQRLKSNKYGADAIAKLNVDRLIDEIDKTDGNRRAKEDAVRAYIGKQHNELTGKLRGIKLPEKESANG